MCCLHEATAAKNLDPVRLVSAIRRTMSPCTIVSTSRYIIFSTPNGSNMSSAKLRAKFTLLISSLRRRLSSGFGDLNEVWILESWEENCSALKLTMWNCSLMHAHEVAFPWSGTGRCSGLRKDFLRSACRMGQEGTASVAGGGTDSRARGAHVFCFPLRMALASLVQSSALSALQGTTMWNRSLSGCFEFCIADITDAKRA
mmetsp:Transcript_42991/g.102062  ORF Transcript_42991/g.102062 Transcript_42991/m.102062 type:complete len:201 (+) Transcript_42991:826-1428(+)